MLLKQVFQILQRAGLVNQQQDDEIEKVMKLSIENSQKIDKVKTGGGSFGTQTPNR